jgi:outer membrane protein TolC
MNIISLLDAQSQLAQARVEYSTSFYNFLTSKAALLKALGKMEKL